MGRLVKAVSPPRRDDAGRGGLESTLGQDETPRRPDDGGGDGYLERVAKYIPAEIVAFTIFSNGILKQSLIDAQASGAPAEMAGFGVRPIGLVLFLAAWALTPVYLWRMREPGDAFALNAGLAFALFPFWAYAIEGVGATAILPFDGHFASILLGAVTLASGLVRPAAARQAGGETGPGARILQGATGPFVERTSPVTSDDKPATAEDLDPGAPPAAAIESGGVEAANLGLDGRGDLPEGVEIEGATEAAPGAAPATIRVEIAKAQAFLQACLTAHPRVTYGLGKKAKAGAVPGRDFTAVDCSGFVREAIRRSTDLGNRFPDGSVVQHDWVKANRFQRVDRAQGAQSDDTVRIAFLSPGDTQSGIGHVVLLFKGKTLESHGGVGPDSRPWTGTGWQAKTTVYILGPSR